MWSKDGWKKGVTMIDEKKLIEDMMNNDGIDFRMDFNTDTEDSVLESLREFADKFRQGMIELVQKQPKVGEWIPVSERLPNKDEYLKNDGRFIVTDGNRVYQSIYDIYSSHCFRTLVLFDFGSRSNFEVDNCVVAWMPLPPAYKE